jgi:hypothetical protein
MGKFEIRNQKFEARVRDWARFLFLIGAWGFGGSAMGQESPSPAAPPPTVVVSGTVAATPAVSAPAEPTVSASAAPVVSASASPTATPPPSLLKKTGVKIQFLPPPMEGTISLGIYDHTGKLVRVLHKEATGDEFVAALDGYITHWDGLDDHGNAMPPGHYSAKGYMVGDVTVEKNESYGGTATASGSNANSILFAPAIPVSGTDVTVSSSNSFISQTPIRVQLVPNPLDRDRAGSAKLTVGFDAHGSWLQLADGLPLMQISNTPKLKWAVIQHSKTGNALAVHQGNVQLLTEYMPASDETMLIEHADSWTWNPIVESYTITKASQMMAFDCGGFDLPTPDN